MTDIADRLRVLASLHSDGHLTDDEFNHQKSTALRSSFSDSLPERVDNDINLPVVWQERFAHFDAYGTPNTPSGKQALKDLGWGQRIRLGANFKAFFFGIIYLLILGLWKRAIVVTAISIALTVMLNVVGKPALANAVGFGIMGFNMWTTNAAFYRKRRTGNDVWNIFS